MNMVKKFVMVWMLGCAAMVHAGSIDGLGAGGAPVVVAEVELFEPREMANIVADLLKNDLFLQHLGHIHLLVEMGALNIQNFEERKMLFRNLVVVMGDVLNGHHGDLVGQILAGGQAINDNMIERFAATVEGGDFGMIFSIFADIA